MTKRLQRPGGPSRTRPMARLRDCFSLALSADAPLCASHLMPFYLPMPASIHCPAANGRICLGFTILFVAAFMGPRPCLLYGTVHTSEYI
ncbi:hypothetical protein J3F84DRAFT_391441 [Trichoderma pleuroticola]